MGNLFVNRAGMPAQRGIQILLLHRGVHLLGEWGDVEESHVFTWKDAALQIWVLLQVGSTHLLTQLEGCEEDHVSVPVVLFVTSPKQYTDFN